MKPIARAATGSRKIVAKKATGSIRAEEFASRFDAVQVGTAGNDTSPFSLWQLGREIERVLVSNGGRPSLRGADVQMKVSVLNEDLPTIHEISKAVAVDKYRPSPAQIASILIHMAVERFSKEEIGKSVRASL